MGSNDSSENMKNSDELNPLKRQLEMTRFERALEVAEGLALRRALLTTAELARLNQILTGRKEDSWRHASTMIELPSGRIEKLTVLSDPVMITRDYLHRATERSEAGFAVDAAVDLYVALVLAHVFEDANRRTAVVASHYFLTRYGAGVPGTALHELGLGDLREEGQVDALRQIVHQMAMFVNKRSKFDSKVGGKFSEDKPKDKPKGKPKVKKDEEEN